MNGTTPPAVRRDEMLRWMRRRRLAAVVFAALSIPIFGIDWLAWGHQPPLECLVLLGVGFILVVVAMIFLLMYGALAVGEARLEPDSSPRKHRVVALSSIPLGCTGIALDIHDYVHDRAWTGIGCPVHCTFARSDFPVGFWVSHVFFLCCFLYFLQVGLISAGKWWRTDGASR